MTSRILAINGLGRPETGPSDEAQPECRLRGAWLKSSQEERLCLRCPSPECVIYDGVLAGVNWLIF